MSRAELDEIQEKLKKAIQNHLVVVARIRNNPQNILAQKQLQDAQKEINLLSIKQSGIVQQLRKDINSKPANQQTGISNQTLPQKSEAEKEQPPVRGHVFPNPKNVRKESTFASIRIPQYRAQRPINIKSKNVPIQPHPLQQIGIINEQKTLINQNRSYDSRLLPQVNEKEMKLSFMSALDLGTITTVKDMQSKRTERKRKSTANPQFSYGSYDPDRRQGYPGFLSYGTKRSRGRPRVPSSTPSPPPKSRPDTPENQADGGSNKSDVLLQTPVPEILSERSPVPPKVGNQGLPQAVDPHEDYCAVCHTIGELLMCDTCNNVYHLHCLEPPLQNVPKGLWSCPDCVSLGRKAPTPPPVNEWSPDSLAMVHNFIAQKAAKEDEKRKLNRRHQELDGERCLLEQKTQHLQHALTAQTQQREEIINITNNNQQTMDKLKAFVNQFKPS